MGCLALALLGEPEVLHAGQQLTFSTRKALALLIYLAVEGGVHSRRKLAELFWPESDTAHGRALLRITLVRLRDALDEASHVGIRPHLIIDHDSLGVDADLSLDLHTVQAAWTLAQPRSGSPAIDDQPTMLDQMEAAVAVYRGDFLSGFSLGDVPAFDDWASVHREAWHRRIDLVFDRLSHLHYDSGELNKAITITTRWIAHDSLNEEAYRRLIRLYGTAGDRIAALRAYESCRMVLAKELKIEPAPETTALAERIRANIPSDPQSRISSPEPQTKEHSASDLLSLIARLQLGTPEAPLIGRATEYRNLSEIFYAVQRGATRMITLEGEAGIGKTRLATDWMAWAAAQGADILQARAFEAGGHLPYQPLVDALRQRLERERAPDDLLSDVWLAELSRLLPELRERYPDLPAPTADETLARTRLFEAVVRLGQAFAARTQVVLFVDDAQWADVDSRDLLHYLARRWAESATSVLLLLTLRSESLTATSTLTEWLSSLRNTLPVTRLLLEPLTPANTLRLVQALSDEQALLDNGRDPTLPATANRHPAEVFGQWLFEETHGQPFYMIETLKALLESGRLTPRLRPGMGWTIDFTTVASDIASLTGFLPPGVHELIRVRIARLTRDAFALLVATAVLGHVFTFELLCQVAGMTEQAGLPALDELLQGHMLREADAERSPSIIHAYTFVHDKIRVVAYAEAGDARRRAFHRRALEALQAANAPLAELAYHALAAGLAEPSVRFSLLAGDEAMGVFATSAAIAHYEQARAMLAKLSHGFDILVKFPASDLQRLHLQLGRAYELTDRPDQARSIYEALLTVARELRDLPLECTALHHLATLAAQNNRDLEGAAALLYEALQIAESSGDQAGLAEVAWNLALIGIYAFEPQTTLLHAHRALTLARQHGLQDLAARSLNAIAYAHMALGQWDETETFAEESQACAAAIGNRVVEADSLSLIAFARINYGHPHGAINAARTAHAISTAIENVWGQVHSAHQLASALLEVGAFEESLKLAQNNVANAQHLSFITLRFLCLNGLGAAQRAVLALDEARKTHLEALALQELLGTRLYTDISASALCEVAVLAEDWTNAHAYARQALAVRSYTLAPLFSLSRWCQTEALIRAGDVELAAEDLSRFGESVGTSRRYQIAYLRALAILARCQGQIDQAVEHLRVAATLAQTIGVPGELWQIQAVLGDLLQSSGDAEGARQAFAASAAVVQSLADNIADAPLRRAFLAADWVRRVLNAGTAG